MPEPNHQSARSNTETDQPQGETAAQGAATSVQPIEPEDAYLTGGKRSLQRRVLGLNVDDNHGHSQHQPAAAAGQHATGSFPDPSGQGDSKKS